MSIERALADLAQLDAEAQRARNRLAEIDEQAGRLRTYVAVAREYERVETGQTAPTSPLITTPTPDGPGEGTLSRRTADIAVELIDAKGQPIHTRDLLAQIAERGVTVGGQNPVANLSGFLSRDKERLVNSRTYGWSLRKWAVGHLAGQPEPRVAGIIGAMDGASQESKAADPDDDDPRDPDWAHDHDIIEQAIAEQEAAAAAADADYEAGVRGFRPPVP